MSTATNTVCEIISEGGLVRVTDAELQELREAFGAFGWIAYQHARLTRGHAEALAHMTRFRAQPEQAKVDGQPIAYRIEWHRSDPAEAHSAADTLDGFLCTPLRLQAETHARLQVKRGYWVEIFNDASDELIAGPLSPEAKLPSYIL